MERVPAGRGHAGVAQLAEQTICNRQVVGSIPSTGSQGRVARVAYSRTVPGKFWIVVLNRSARAVPVDPKAGGKEWEWPTS